MIIYPILSLSMFLLPEFIKLFRFMIWNHSGFSWLPRGWANFSELIGVFESLNHSDEFISISSDWEIIDRHMSQNSISINDVSGSESNTGITSVFNEASIIL